VPEYWVVDLDARAVERWRPQDRAPEVVRDQLEWRPVGSTEPLLLDLTAFFLKLGGEGR
jgi:Uma2 family endonuclease